MKYEITRSENLLILQFSPVLMNGDILRYTVKQDKESEWPVKFFTATTDMRDFIANTTGMSRDGFYCKVKGVYRGETREVNNVLVKDNGIRKHPGDRVMVTEHVNPSGKMEFIATKKRILKGDLNFISFGWSDENRCRFLRVDVYTGDSAYLIGRPCYSFVQGI